MIVALCLALAPQTLPADAWFHLHPAPPERAAARFLVSGSRSAAPAGEALRRLARLMEWEFTAPSAEAHRRLAAERVDLAFSKQDPRDIARWIAAAAGVEATLVGVGRRIELQLGLPAAASLGELRSRATEWYRSVIDDPTAAGTARMAALTGLARTLLDAGQDRRAIELFQQVFEQDTSGRFDAPALLAAAGAHWRLARQPAASELQRRLDLQAADQTLRRLLQHGRADLHAAAAVLLGRVLVAQGRDRDCVALLERLEGRLRRAPEWVDARLLLAGCHHRSGDPQRVVAVLDHLAAGGHAWTRTQWLEFHYLRGTALAAVARGAVAPAAARQGFEAMRSLEWYLGADHGTADRRHRAWLELGRIYLAAGKYVDARAVVHRLLDDGQLAAGRADEARVLEARVLTALGFADRARARLQLALRADPDGLPAVRAFLAGSQPATTVAAPAEPPAPDPARALEWAQAGVRRWAAAAKDPAAPLADLFQLARCHEILHREARLDRRASPQQAARHLQQACDLFDRIERRDRVRQPAGNLVSGPWAIAAQSARAMMLFVDEQPRWTPPRLAVPPR